MGIDKTGEGEKKKSLIREYIEAIVVAVLLAVVIRTFVIQAFKIPSGSMIPTLLIGDHILVNKFIFWFKEPHRGDVVVFKYPLDPRRDFIKRVIGLPGDNLEIKDKVVHINGQPLHEPYAIFTDNRIQSKMISPRDNFGPVTVPEESYFMMGDNRDNSADSRFWGFLEDKGLFWGDSFGDKVENFFKDIYAKGPMSLLDTGKIKGKAFIIYWSWKPGELEASENTKKWEEDSIIHLRWKRVGKLIN